MKLAHKLFRLSSQMSYIVFLKRGVMKKSQSRFPKHSTKACPQAFQVVIPDVVHCLDSLPPHSLCTLLPYSTNSPVSGCYILKDNILQDIKNKLIKFKLFCFIPDVVHSCRTPIILTCAGADYYLALLIKSWS